jgi:hypothetical protein
MFGVYFYGDLWSKFTVRMVEDPHKLVIIHLQI